MRKSDKIIFYIATGLFSFLMLFSASMYIFSHEVAVDAYTALGFPTYIIYPLAIAKLLGLVAIWSNLSKVLKYLAYSGFFFNMILAISAHINVNDGEFFPSLIGLILIVTSFVFDRRLQQAKG